MTVVANQSTVVDWKRVTPAELASYFDVNSNRGQ